MPHVWLLPADIAMKRKDASATCVGANHPTDVLSIPSRPTEFVPQHLAIPSGVIPQVWAAPAETVAGLMHFFWNVQIVPPSLHEAPEFADHSWGFDAAHISQMPSPGVPSA